MGVQGGRDRGDALEKDLGQGFSQCNMHTNLLEIMLKCRLWFAGLGRDLSVFLTT